MKINFKEQNIEFNNGIIISFWQTLIEIFKHRQFNWNIFQFFLIEFENDTMCGAYEFTFVFFCCGIKIRIPHKTEKSKKFWKEIDNSKNDIFHKSCYGWCNKDQYKLFKEKTVSSLIIQTKRGKGKYFTKKLFIQQ